MKKRIISMLLTVLLVMSLFTGVTVSAYADDSPVYTQVYTLAEGDTVLKVCQRLGLNFYTCQNIIMSLNNITSEAKFRYLSVGQEIILPVSDAAAIQLTLAQRNATSNGNSTAAAAAATPISTSGTSTNKGYTACYYLIPYVMQYGDTIVGACNALGINYAAYKDQIQKINNLSSLNSVKSGKTILLPTTNTPIAGTNCYLVIAHKVNSGDTASTICSSYGINYKNNTKILEYLNSTSNLANIKAGANFYLPISTVIPMQNSSAANNNNAVNNNNNAAGNNNNNGTTTTTSTTTTKTNPDGTTTTTTVTTTTDKSMSVARFKLTSNMNSSYGTMYFYVNNVAVNTACAGDVVTIDVVTAENKALSSLTVKYADGTADLKLDTSTFIMPACDVRIDAAISSGYDIEIDTNNNYYVAATVDGLPVNSASQGSNVRIVTTDTAYELEDIKVTYSNWLGMKKEVSVTEDNFFLMPARKVTITANVKPVATYAFYRADSANGNFDLQVNGFSAIRAAKGAKVTIVWQAMAGYELNSITVTKHDSGDPVNVLNNSFTMPACDVDVTLTFGTKDNAIIIKAFEGGMIEAVDGGGVHITEAATGDNVTLQMLSFDDGYTANFTPTVVRNSDGNLVNVVGNQFTMPAGGVTISGVFDGEVVDTYVNFYDLEGNAITGNDNVIYLRSSNNEYRYTDALPAVPQSIAVGTKLAVSDLTRTNLVLDRIEVYVNGIIDNELTDSVTRYGFFIVPNTSGTDIDVDAFYSSDSIVIGPADINGVAEINSEPLAAVSYKVSDDLATWTPANSCRAGQYVKIITASTYSGYIADKASDYEVIEKGTGMRIAVTQDADGFFFFQMPGNGVDITVNFTGLKSNITMQTVLVNPDGSFDTATAQGESFWKLTVDFNAPNVDNQKPATVVPNVPYNSQISLYLTEVVSYDYFISNIDIQTATKHFGLYGEEGGIKYSEGKYSFAMPESDTTITVYVTKNKVTVAKLNDLSYDASKGMVSTEVQHRDELGIWKNMGMTDECYYDDVVIVRANAIAPNAFKKDGFKVQRNSDAGLFTYDENAADVANDTMLAGRIYYIYDGGATPVGWKYIMPEYGAKMWVDFKSGTSKVTLFILDAVNDSAFAPDVTGTGLLRVSAGGSDYVDNVNVIENVAPDASVNISLSNAGETKYSLEKLVVVKDSDSKSIEVYGTGFNMPAENVTAYVYLKEKVVVETPINLSYYCNDSANGSISFYSDVACTNAIDSALPDTDVFFKCFAKAGYSVDSLTAAGASAVGTVDPDITKNVYTFTMPKNGMDISMNVTLNADFTVTIHGDGSQLRVNGGAWSVMPDSGTKAATYTNVVELQISQDAIDAGKRISKIEITGAMSKTVTKAAPNSASVSFQMPAGDVDITVTLE